MQIGEPILIGGCVVQEKFVAGRTLAQIERILGFHPGRLGQGMVVAGLLRLPTLSEFSIAGYSNVATHRQNPPGRVDVEKLKTIARGTWTTRGTNRLVKILPTIAHDQQLDPDIQYPPGQGAPQWVLQGKQQGTILAVVKGYPDARLPPSGP